MSVRLTPHLNFRGEARAALEFYQAVFGGQLQIVTYGDMGAVQNPAEADQVVWGQVSAGDGIQVMAFDVPAERPWNRGEHAFYVSLRGSEPAEIARYWEGLVAGATVIQPLGPSPWAPLYGMLEDQFGVIWVLDVVAEYAAG